MKMDHQIYIGVLFLVGCTHVIKGYPNGPPVDTQPSLCLDMMPEHNAAPSTSDVPYQITINTDCYKPNMQLTVEVSSIPTGAFSNPNPTTIKGLFVQARPTNGLNVSIGTFDENGNSKLQSLNCFNTTMNALGHTERLDSNSVTFKWIAPAQEVYNGEIRFRATVVEKKKKFWIGVASEDIPFRTNCTHAETTTSLSLTTLTSGTMATTPSNADKNTISMAVTLTMTTLLCALSAL